MAWAENNQLDSLNHAILPLKRFTDSCIKYNKLPRFIFASTATVYGLKGIKAISEDVRPEPTPFDAETAVTVDAILGGITTELAAINNSHDISYEVIGNGIYLSSSNPFNIQIPNKDLMRVMHSDINTVADLPTQCKHGYVVKVKNSIANEDDYDM